MNIEAKNLSKIMVTVKTEWWLWIMRISKLYPAILFLLWDHLEAEKVPCFICFPAWISHLPDR